MAKTLLIDLTKVAYDAEDATFTTDENYAGFATEYELVNPKTNGREVFTLSHSTGSEWDPKTVWIYFSESGLKLEIMQDAAFTEKRAAAYLNHKLNRD